MKNLNKNIDNDITYLLEQIGHTVKVENEDVKAIVNNSDLERTFDDKRIITTAKLKRGNYIEYNDLNFIVLNEINDRRYQTYNKAIMRNCNFNLKFVLDGYLYLFHAIIESEQSKLKVTSGMIQMVADSIIVTLPNTDITKKITTDTRFISMGRKWEIEHIDYTRNGLLILTCPADLFDSSTDDLENEIANVDQLIQTDLTPIYPFDTISEPTEPEPTELTITGSNRLTIWDEDIIYTINTDKPVTWTLDNEKVLKITSQSDNHCIINPISTSNIGHSVLTCTLIDDPETFIEYNIALYYA